MKVSADPWETILTSIEPNWKEMQVILSNGPMIRPKIFKKGRNWHLKLIEIWPIESYVIDWTSNVDQLQSTIEWTSKILETWDTAKRESWDTWSFKFKKDAEKFVTYYNLTCRQ